MTIVLVRHGATALNLARVLQPPDTPLNAGGCTQAEAVARALVGIRPAALLSSDLPRAAQTAQAIARATGLPIETSALLHERNFGDLRGQAYDLLGFDPLTMAEAPAGGESSASFEHRVGLAFECAVRRRADLGGPLVVVTHGLVIRAMLAGPIGLPKGRLTGLHIGNASITVLAAQAPHTVEMLNATDHLDPDARGEARGLVGG